MRRFRGQSTASSLSTGDLQREFGNQFKSLAIRRTYLPGHLASGRTRLLGLIVPAMSDPFFAEVAQWFEETAWALGYEMLVSPIGSNAERRSYFIGRMRERKVEGVAVMVFDLDSALIEEFSVLKVPIVYVNAALEFADAPLCQ